jgi:hypothetical protein
MPPKMTILETMELPKEVIVAEVEVGCLAEDQGASVAVAVEVRRVRPLIQPLRLLGAGRSKARGEEAQTMIGEKEGPERLDGAWQGRLLEWSQSRIRHCREHDIEYIVLAYSLHH